MKYCQMFTSDLNYVRHMTAIRNNIAVVAWLMQQLVGHPHLISSCPLIDKSVVPTLTVLSVLLSQGILKRQVFP